MTHTHNTHTTHTHLYIHVHVRYVCILFICACAGVYTNLFWYLYVCRCDDTGLACAMKCFVQYFEAPPPPAALHMYKDKTNLKTQPSEQRTGLAENISFSLAGVGGQVAQAGNA
ncbi:hypothetical protein EMCRGX_G012944 [Ephydatia muelleri]